MNRGSFVEMLARAANVELGLLWDAAQAPGPPPDSHSAIAAAMAHFEDPGGFSGHHDMRARDDRTLLAAARW